VEGKPIRLIFSLYIFCLIIPCSFHYWFSGKAYRKPINRIELPAFCFMWSLS